MLFSSASCRNHSAFVETPSSCGAAATPTHVLAGICTKFQMSLSSFGNFSASGAAMQLAPDCSSALGLYVPSVCLFFFTTQRSQARTADAMATTPRTTVGATIAAMLSPCTWKNHETVINLETLDAFRSDLRAMIKVCHSHEFY